MAGSNKNTRATTSYGEASRQADLGLQSRPPQPLGSPREAAYGLIVETIIVPSTDGNSRVEVRVAFEDDVYRTVRAANRALSMAYPIDVIAQMFGNDLTGRRCRVEFTSPDKSYGIVFIAHERDSAGDIEKASTLPAYGTMIWSAGS